MKNIIREKRKIAIASKRINSKIIRLFAKVVQEQFELESNAKNDSVYLMYSIDTTDNSSYESQSIEIFDEGEMLDQKKLSRVNIRFNTLYNSKNIEIEIAESYDKEKSTSFIQVSGDDPAWVNWVRSKFSEIIALAEPQPIYNKNLIDILIFVVGCFMVILSYIKINQLCIGDWCGLVTLTVLITVVVLGIRLSRYIKSLYPYIELQTGADHMQVQRLKRKKLYVWMSLFFFPILSSIIFEILRWIVNG